MSTATRKPQVAPARRAGGDAGRRAWWRSRSLKGVGYTAPTAAIVLVLFLAPLVLVLWMSLNRWPLLGRPRVNAPDNYTRIPDNPLFLDAVGFT
jgi:multiple sugar transport system permease protein